MSARLKGKCYTIKALIGYDLNGKKVFHTVCGIYKLGQTRAQIKQELSLRKKQCKNEAKDKRLYDKDITFAEFSEKWFADYADKQLKKETVNYYRVLIKQINSIIGHIKLTMLSPQHILSFYKDLEISGARMDTKCKPLEVFSYVLKSKGLTVAQLSQRAGLSSGILYSCRLGNNITLNNAVLISRAIGMDVYELFTPVVKEYSPVSIIKYHRLISSILTKAVKSRAIPSNPCRKMKPPNSKKATVKCLNEKELALLLKKYEAQPVLLRTIIHLILFSGIRRSELCGLKWKDIDFEKHLIHIARVAVYRPGKGVCEESLSNDASNRTIRLPPEVIKRLKIYMFAQYEQKMSANVQRVDSNWVFTSGSREPIHPNAVTKLFGDFTKEYFLTGVTLQTLRNTYASILVSKGTPITAVRKRLGYVSKEAVSMIVENAKRPDLARTVTLYKALSGT